jgi:Zn-dependent metalloprotease
MGISGSARQVRKSFSGQRHTPESISPTGFVQQGENLYRFSFILLINLQGEFMYKRVLNVLSFLLLFSLIVSPVQAAPARSNPGETAAAPAIAASPTPAPALQTYAAGIGNTGDMPPIDPVGLAALRAKTGGPAVSIAPQTGAVRFVRFTAQQSAALTAALNVRQAPGATPQAARAATAKAFFAAYGSVFGIQSMDRELALADTQSDALGTQLVYQQVDQGVPVFAGTMKVHFTPQGQIRAVNGLFIPGLSVDPTPQVTVQQAERVALKGAAQGVAVKGTQLLIYRENLAHGLPGENHLAYEVELSDGETVHEYVYVDAHSAVKIDTIQAANDATISVYDSAGDVSTPVFSGTQESTYSDSDPIAEDIFTTTKETFNLYKNLSGGTYLSFNGLDAAMNNYMNYTDPYDPNFCPNAQWNGTETDICAGVVADDIVAHEWSHAYTDYNHDLIYAWQPGALNEAYSDIFGESVDLLNGRGTDSPDAVRTTEVCSKQESLAPELTIQSPVEHAGAIDQIGQAGFGPALTETGITGDVVQVTDGVLTTNDGCEDLTNASAVSGKIALIQRGTCNFTVKVKNAQVAGAVAAIIYNSSESQTIINMGGEDASITIPSLLVNSTVGGYLTGGGNVTMKLSADPALVDSYRWLIGEDSTTLGVLRDMRNPNCLLNAGKVSDDTYSCTDSDHGGVHSNSGVPNHTYAILVDGDTDQGITGIGINKALAIYWRAEHVYQHRTTDFADHADALETSCSDLKGATIYNPLTGAPLSETITDSDCASLSQAIAVTELRTPPTQCNFQPLLAKGTPAKCDAGLDEGHLINYYVNNFDSQPSGWTVSSESDSPVFNTPDWTLTASLPASRAGEAFYAINSPDIGDCQSDDQSGIRYLQSPLLTVPQNPPYRFSFTHYVATEAGYDGGVVQIKVNNGVWTTIDPTAFHFNGYNLQLAPPPDIPYLAGEPAFSGSDGGTPKGSWGDSIIYLDDYLQPGDHFSIRFALAQDGCGGNDGWYVDNPQFYGCTHDPYPLYLPQVSKK